jgi:hypothetical protein
MAWPINSRLHQLLGTGGAEASHPTGVDARVVGNFLRKIAKIF